MATTNLATNLAPATAQPVALPARTWDIDQSHASAVFKVRHLMVSKVRGELGPVSGTVVIDEDDITRSSIDVRIDARGLNTRDAKRDEHLRSADFFDVAQHPTVGFVSTQVRRGRDGALEVAGDLSIRGVTRPVTLEVEPLPAPIADPWGNARRGATARAQLSRKEWGLTWNMALETGGVVVGDKVEIEIDVELIGRKNV
jgi:polyisoprenoid-binding protein YceI